MALIKCKKCKKCNKYISHKVNICPSCGTPIKKKTPIVTWVVFIFFILVLINVLLDKETQPQKINTNNKVSKQKYSKEPLPEGFSYKILYDESNDALQKNQLTIEISEKISIKQIASLAQDLYSTKTKQRRFYMFYLLPNMKKGSGAWAISHFNPDLKIKIIGSTKQEEELSNKLGDKTPGKILGKWYEQQYVSSTFILFKKNNAYFIRHIFKNGQILDEEMTPIKINNGIKYIHKNGGYDGEYFILNKLGDLELYNGKGKHFTTAKKIQ